MNNLVVFGGAGPSHSMPVERIIIDGTSLGCGLVPAAHRAIDRDAGECAHAVLVRTSALSCNYRDRTLLHQLADVPASRYTPIGSEFVGEVIDVGPAVTSLRVGDRVIPNHHYTGGLARRHGEREGIVTNQASRRLQLVTDQRLAVIPAGMPDEVAAAFSLGAQTAYSMVRRLEPEQGGPVLVMSGGSNTSLFVIAALTRAGAGVYATTTSVTCARRLEAIGVEHVIVRPRGRVVDLDADPLHQVAKEIGGFAAVVDPFYDLHLAHAVVVLRPFGRYVTCGFAAQNAHQRAAAAPRPIDVDAILVSAIQKNLTIMGNCIGLASDLTNALRDYEAGGLRTIIDSVFDGDRIAAFFDRTYNDPARFGKVVYRYRD